MPSFDNITVFDGVILISVPAKDKHYSLTGCLKKGLLL